ncbi:uroporphyrinogen-III C-methyltransferase [Antribacter gilvus]|uniref:uroporphyrinogen-III C-methyltransferase n=1 Tax=Antribacter gilvus TaxID=2304675 RepID=UPI000F7803DB|nr:uroporphyrinogen-III C-methyltransferase [Antribacter gilvus]
MSDLYPLGLRLSGRRVLVVGGGPVAARRARGLVEAGAVVRVVAPEACEELASLAAGAGGPGTGGATVELVLREYRTGDVDGVWLVHTATGDPAVDARVAADAEAARTFCVTAGDATLGTGWVPAVGRVGSGGDEVTVAVSAGRDPRRAVAVRDAVAAELQTGALPLRRVRATGSRAGRVALVGGGPGAPGLITARGRVLLAQADVVVADRLGPRMLLEELADDVLVIDVGKTSGNHPVPQDEINALLVEHALAGRDVVRLKGGDPYVLGRGGEELAACRAHGIEVEVVPGVTSAVSVPAAAGIPVTHRGVARGFSVLTGHEDTGSVPGGPDHTLVLLMGVSRLAEAAATLVTDERPAGTPVAVIEDGYGPRQRVTVGTLGTIAALAEAAGVRPPAIIVVGDVVRLSPHWTATA